jgi:phosphatidate cytidylyltransferase
LFAVSGQWTEKDFSGFFLYNRALMPEAQAKGLDAMRDSSTSMKIIGGLLLGPIVLYMAVRGDWLLLALAAFAVVAGLIEFYGLLRASGMHPLPWLGIPLGLIFLVTAYAGVEQSVELILSLAVLAALLLQFFRYVRGGQKLTMSDLAVTIFGSIYLGALLSYLFQLKGMYQSYYADVTPFDLLVLLPMAAAWASDAGALFAGKAMGRTPLAPKVSPKKTIEGAAGGLASAVMFSVLVCSILKIGIGHGIAIGLICGVFGQIGDLAESAFKREVQVKDTGNLILGAGGVLDRADSILFTIPLTYFYLKLFVAG